MAEGKILPYLDIPFQHASPRILKAMRRPAHQEKTLERIAKWRGIAPDIGIRSTFIVGFPGETEADFEELLAWLDEASLDRVGCFRFEPVAGAPANALGNPVPDEVKEERWHRFMQAQQRISARNLQRKIGRRIRVIVDESSGRTAKGRSVWDAPEIDGTVHLSGRLPIRSGEIVTVKVDRADAYDLYGQVV
jgi:ribosomal protein S12 methylthiotransferase